ncbi:abortive infection family protein [candidate division WOR-3 bacterium]|nr:abortive infection family protein [candidate division WOR-3 bacterium]
MEVKISQETLEFLRDVITGDKKISAYNSGPKLVSFFNSLGFNDTYGRGFPSRRDYTETRLRELNEQERINEVFEAYFNPRNFIGKEDLLYKLRDRINEYLKYDGYKLEINDRRAMLVSTAVETIEVPEISKLDNEVIRENIEKCDNRIKNGDFTGAITSARSFLEGLLLYIYLQIKGEKYTFTGDLPRLYKDVAKLIIKLNTAENTANDIKKVLGGLTAIVAGVSGISNRMADRHGRLAQYNQEMLRHVSILTVNSVKTLSLYLYSCYEEVREQDTAGNL